MISRPDPDHQRVIESQVPHLVVVAPPGTGKTHLALRLASRIVPGLGPGERVLLVTFSNQARAQLEREARNQSLAPEFRSVIEITNYHGFFRREVWAYRRALGLPMHATIVPSKGRKALFAAASRGAFKACERHSGLVESLAEHNFARFRDARTPAMQSLNALMGVVHSEHRAGRILFDDLGALFWEMLERYPTLARAYAARYPVVIADEHQDASELQDAFVRRLGTKRLIVFADQMQQIYGFRGSSPARLEAHLRVAGEVVTLKTPHRWHGNENTGQWLLAVRERLEGRNALAVRPPGAAILRARYSNVVKSMAKQAVARAFEVGLETVAVISAFNPEVFGIRDYLSREGMYPKQLGGSDDFEAAHDAMEQLPLLQEPASLCHYAVDRIAVLVPSLETATVKSIKSRIGADGVRIDARSSEDAKAVLMAVSRLYRTGAAGYFSAIAEALARLADRKHNLPRLEAVRAVRATADALTSGTLDLDAALATFAGRVATAAQWSHQIGRGLYVLTAHQSKGKEFDAVVIAHAGAREFPDDPDGRRLFYVALTRATKSWTIIAPEDNPTQLLHIL